MPLQEQDHALIEKHLLDRLSTTEQSVFEERMSDSDFKKELDVQRDLMVAFKSEGRAHLKNQLQSFEKNIKGAAKSDSTVKINSFRSFSIGRILTIAASIAFLLFAGYWLSNLAPSNEQLFAQYFSDYPNVVAPIDKGVSDSDPIFKAFQTYELKEYEKALSLISALNVQNETTAFYKGLCELALDHPQKAIAYLDNVKDTSLSIYQASLWYKALAFLKLGNTTEAKSLLKIVVENAETKGLKNQAIGLLEKI
jgi:tetratricopeptide (TPR) repeat protein